MLFFLLPGLVNLAALDSLLSNQAAEAMAG